MKEDLRRVLWQEPCGAGEACLEIRIGQARASRAGALIRLGQTVQKHAEGITNCYRHRISTAPLEGFAPKLEVPSLPA